MKEHPILFSSPMVQAILEGRKTMTRRIVKCYPASEAHPARQTANWQSENKTCPYGQPGDLLWVREKFAKTIGVHEPEITYSYFADSFHWSFYPNDDMKGETSCQWHDADLAKEVRWKPAIHMPKASARIWLEVEGVRVERLHEIGEEDVKLEGCHSVSWFEGLWGKLHGDFSWEQNPWVWVVRFKVLSTIGKPPL